MSATYLSILRKPEAAGPAKTIQDFHTIYGHQLLLIGKRNAALPRPDIAVYPGAGVITR